MAAPLRLGPGFHLISDEAYQADPAPEPSLRASAIDDLLTLSPATYAARAPRLAPPPESEEEDSDRSTRAQRLGSLVHALILGRGKRVQVVDAPDWRAKAAKEARAAALEADLLPVLATEWAQASRVAKAVQPQIVDEYGDAWEGESEVTMVWRRETALGPIWCRAMVDRLCSDTRLIVDLKATEMEVDDLTLARKFASAGGAYQAAFHVSGVEALHPHQAGRVRFEFAVVELQPPHQLRIVELPPAYLHMAGRRIERAAEIFAACQADGRWPPYPRRTQLQMPRWQEAQWLAEELEDSE